MSIMGRNETLDCPGWSPLVTDCIMADHPGRGERSGHTTFHNRSSFHVQSLVLSLVCLSYISCTADDTDGL